MMADGLDYLLDSYPGSDAPFTRQSWWWLNHLDMVLVVGVWLLISLAVTHYQRGDKDA